MLPILVSAALFGAALPLCKLLLGKWDALPLAGVLYLASGIGLHLLRPFVRAGEPLRRPDLPWLAAGILFGGVAAPLSLLYGLRLTTGYAGSLLMNLESVFTAAIAVTLFGERLARRDTIALVVLVAGAAVVGLATAEEKEAARPLLGAALVALACLFWGFDNNFTQRISARDPLQIAGIKGLVAGATNLTLGLALGQRPPSGIADIGGAALIGLFGNGISLALFVVSLRRLGSAKTGALFAMAPLSGLALSWLALRESPQPLALAGGAVMIVAVVAMAVRSEPQAAAAR